MNGILIIAHAPLASALRQCVLHVFPDSANAVSALDVQPNVPPEESLAQSRALMRQLGLPNTLVVTDVFGATPCNVAQKLVDGVSSKLITGVNLPMLLRTVSYRHESLDALVSRAMIGATQGVIQVAVTAPRTRPEEPPMIKTTVTISNKLGLHARASAKLTKLAASFASEVWMSRGERRVNAKSIMGVMMLAAGLGSTVEIETIGSDEQVAMDALVALVNDRFGEGE